MADPIQHYTQKKTQELLAQTQSVIHSVVVSWEPQEFREAVLRFDEKWIRNIVDEYRPFAAKFFEAYANTISRYFQLQSIIEDTWKIFLMAGKYPWHGTQISKSDHFHFVWLSFTHHCYLFEERSKQFYEDWKHFLTLIKQPQMNAGIHLKEIQKGLKEYIKHRGMHTHEGNIVHESYKTFLSLEEMDRHTDEFSSYMKSDYFVTKREMRQHMLMGISTMASEFLNLQGTPHDQLKIIVKPIHELIFAK